MNKMDRNDYDVAASQAAQENFDTIATQVESVLNTQESAVRTALNLYSADGVTDQFHQHHRTYITMGNEVKSIIKLVSTTLAQTDEHALLALSQARNATAF